MITVRNVNEALSVILTFFKQEDQYREISPRGIYTRELRQMPFVTRYQEPTECVLFNPMRNANPFFHFFEALWVVCGRDDLKFMFHLLPRYKDYSDDGITLHGAYGARLYAHDQIGLAIEQLKKDKDSRRAVVMLWQPHEDAGYIGKDMPCNCMLDFKIRDDALDLIVANRSNDAVWGAYGSNAVQFSFLLQWVAMQIGVKPGYYTQVSNSMHCYPDNEPTKTLLRNPISYFDLYREDVVTPAPWLTGFDVAEDWDEDMARFFDLFDSEKLGTSMDYETGWWANVAYPMWMAFNKYKDNNMKEARSYAESIHSSDWRTAAVQWFDRVEAKREVRK